MGREARRGPSATSLPCRYPPLAEERAREVDTESPEIRSRVEFYLSTVQHLAVDEDSTIRDMIREAVADYVARKEKKGGRS